MIPQKELRFRCKGELQNVLRQLLGGSRKQDCANTGWAYCKQTFGRRVQQVCEAFGAGAERHAALRAALRAPACCVVSIGGGPGNDLFGFVLYEKLAGAYSGVSGDGGSSGGSDGGDASGDGYRAGPSEQRLFIFDQDEQWVPMVRQVAAIAGEGIDWGPCNVAAPLHGCAQGRRVGVVHHGVPHPRTQYRTSVRFVA